MQSSLLAPERGSTDSTPVCLWKAHGRPDCMPLATCQSDYQCPARAAATEPVPCLRTRLMEAVHGNEVPMNRSISITHLSSLADHIDLKPGEWWAGNKGHGAPMKSSYHQAHSPSLPDTSLGWRQCAVMIAAHPCAIISGCSFETTPPRQHSGCGHGPIVQPSANKRCGCRSAKRRPCHHSCRESA
jgi:hypothetical protein